MPKVGQIEGVCSVVDILCVTFSEAAQQPLCYHMNRYATSEKAGSMLAFAITFAFTPDLPRYIIVTPRMFEPAGTAMIFWSAFIWKLAPLRRLTTPIVSPS